MPVKKKVSKKKVKGTKSKKRSKKKSKGTKSRGTKATRTKSRGTKAKRTKTGRTKAKRTKTYKKQVQLKSNNEELDKKCGTHNGKSKDCRSARTADGSPECWYNYDTNSCTGFVSKQ